MIILIASAWLQLGVDPTSKLKTPTNVNSFDSLLQCSNDRSLSGLSGCDITITPNPSYCVDSNSKSESEYQYAYVQANASQNNKVENSTVLGKPYSNITGLAGNVNIDPNPSYSLLEDIKLNDNPAYRKLQLH